MAAEGHAQDTKKALDRGSRPRLRAPLAGRSADQSAQPVSLTAPGVPTLDEFVADQLANLEQPVDLRLHQVRFSPFHGHCVPFHRHGGRTSLARFKRKYAVKLGGVDPVVAGEGLPTTGQN